MGLTPASLALYHSRGKWTFARHLQLLNALLMRVMAGEITRIILNMPPRHGKSELFSKYLPVCYVGNFPNRNVILASYQAEFAASWGRKAKNIMLEVGEEVYGITLGKSSDHNWTVFGRDGGMQTCGSGGALTGKGANLLLIDDPIKNAQEAQSQTAREHQWDWLVSTALTRLEPNGVVAILMTRWHEDDLCGRVLQLAKETGEEWVHVSMPAICEDETSEYEQFLGRKNGDPLWPERFGHDRLKIIKQNSHFWWNGLYQQRPAPLEGHLVKSSWFRYFDTQMLENGQVFYTLHKPEEDVRVAKEDCVIFFTIDLAASTKTSADFTVVSVWALVRKTSDLLWLTAVAERMEGPDQQALIDKMNRQWKPQMIGVEAVAYQLTLIQSLIRNGLPAFKLKADKDKISRFLPAGVAYQNGQIYHPNHAEWVSDMEDQLLHFPNSAHDDFVDTCAYAIRMMGYIQGAGMIEVTGA